MVWIMTYTLFYTSADGPGENATWSVYSEQYENIMSPEPINGSQEKIWTYPTEQEANDAASRYQRESYRKSRIDEQATKA